MPRGPAIDTALRPRTNTPAMKKLNSLLFISFTSLFKVEASVLRWIRRSDQIESWEISLSAQRHTIVTQSFLGATRALKKAAELGQLCTGGSVLSETDSA